jgi:chemotaxis signal transduction protein
MQRLLVTRIGRRNAGWLTGDLTEVVAAPRLFPLPFPLPYVRATAFRRGNLVTVVDCYALMGEASQEREGGLLLRLAHPLSHLAFLVSSVEAVIPYSELSLREDHAEGIWAGLYPWEDLWVNVVKPSAAAAELSQAMATAIHQLAAGRDHAS